jgi:hypothetical protein
MKRLILTLVLAVPAFAGEEMRKLEFLIGDWAGEASVRMGPGEPQHVTQTETIQWKAAGEAMLIEGLGKDASGKVVHNAVALIHWDPELEAYRMNTVVAGRGAGSAVLEVTGARNAVWRLEGPWGQQRYTIEVNDAGEWIESGEFSRDGKTWMKTVEMKLKRK